MVRRGLVVRLRATLRRPTGIRRVRRSRLRRRTGIPRVPATCLSRPVGPGCLDGRSRPTPGTSPTPRPARRRLRRAGAVVPRRHLRRVLRGRRVRGRVVRPHRLRLRRRVGMWRRRWFPGSGRTGLVGLAVRRGLVRRSRPVLRTLPGVRLRVGCTMPRRCLPIRGRVGLGRRGRGLRSRRVPLVYPGFRARPSRLVLPEFPVRPSRRTLPALPATPVRRAVRTVPCITRRPCSPGPRWVGPGCLRRRSSRARPVRWAPR